MAAQGPEGEVQGSSIERQDPQPPPLPEEQRAETPLTHPTEALYWTQYGVWYPLFRKYAPKSSIIDIEATQPHDFVEWFQSETFTMPVGSGPATSTSTVPSRFEDLESGSSSSTSTSTSSDSDSDSDSDSNAEPIKTYQLTALDAAIRKTVIKYDGGPVFPKLNWSAPQDASFMLAGNNLQCRHPEDVYLLLKSSEFVGRDWEQIQELCGQDKQTQTQVDVQDRKGQGQGQGQGQDLADQTRGEDGNAPITATDSHSDIVGETTVTTTMSSGSATQHTFRLQLVLKQWFSISRSHEFRCFIRQNRLLAIAQRDMTYYAHLQPSSVRGEIRDKIYDCWCSVVQKQSEFKLKDYILDVYLTKNRERVWIVDFNPYLPRTDPLLFGFHELDAWAREAAARPTEEPDDTDNEVIRLPFKFVHPPTKTSQTSQVTDSHQATESGPHPNPNPTSDSESESEPGSDSDSDSESASDLDRASQPWGVEDIKFRVIRDSRLGSYSSSSATYSSNMVPQDLIQFAKQQQQQQQNRHQHDVQGMAIDQIVDHWNRQTLDMETEGDSGSAHTAEKKN